MISRTLTGVALTGTLLAAGCGGGGSPGSQPVSTIPSIGGPAIGGPTTTAKGRGSFVASFSIPYSAARANASNNRSPLYLSPGTSGLTILVGNGTTTGVGGAAQTAQLSTAILIPQAATGATLAGATVVLSPGTLSLATQPSIGQQLTIAAGVGTGTFTITAVNAAGYNLTGNWSGLATGANDTAASGTTVSIAGGSAAQTAVIGTVATPLALAAGTTTKSIPLAVNGATATSTVTYSFAPAATAGYYTFSAAFNNFAAGTAETIGVVTTDILHNNFVLAEGQTAVTIPAGGGQAVPATVTLTPVVANVFVPTPTVITSLTGTTSLPTLGTLETTVFATDELGYVIPSTAGTPENTPVLTLAATTAANLVFKKYTAPYTTAGILATSLTALPASGVVAATGSAGASFVTLTDTATTGGTLLNNILTPSAPFSLATNGAATTPVITNSAGNPVNITCGTSSASVAWNAVLTSVLANPVTGYTHTAGVDYPAATTTLPLTAINCTPGFTVPIQ